MFSYFVVCYRIGTMEMSFEQIVLNSGSLCWVPVPGLRNLQNLVCELMLCFAPNMLGFCLWNHILLLLETTYMWFCSQGILMPKKIMFFLNFIIPRPTRSLSPRLHHLLKRQGELWDKTRSSSCWSVTARPLSVLLQPVASHLLQLGSFWCDVTLDPPLKWGHACLGIPWKNAIIR